MLIQIAAERHSKPPTVRCLAGDVQVGLATMHSYLGKLAQEGMLEWHPKSHRSVRLTPTGFLRLRQVSAPQL